MNKEEIRREKVRQLIQQKYSKSVNENFDGELEAMRLHRALCGFRIDSSTIINILGSCNQFRILKISNHYKRLIGRKLSDDIEMELAGLFQSGCENIITEPNSVVAKHIHSFLQEFPEPDESSLVAVLCDRSNEEVSKIQNAYSSRYNISLENSIKKHLNSDIRGIITTLINPKREIGIPNYSLAQSDAQELVHLGIAVRFNKNAPVITTLLRKRSYSHLRIVFHDYFNLTGGHHIWNKIEKQLPSSQRNRLIMIMMAIYDPELFVVKILRDLRYSNKFGDMILNMRTSRSLEFCRQVKDRYKDIHNTKIKDEITRHTSGEYCALLLRVLQFR